MERDDVIAIIQCFESSSAASFELNTAGLTLRLSKGPAAAAGSVQDGQDASSRPAAAAAPPQQQAGAEPAKPAPAAAAPAAPPGHRVTAPMVGTFYRRPAPDREPFVEPGKAVRKGDTLCLIEVMKVLNTVTAEHDGTVAAILVEDGSLVEYGQDLLVIAPAAEAP
jgi:acetyl-CoA carboxylase biotin carboxyl carrier protein